MKIIKITIEAVEEKKTSIVGIVIVALMVLFFFAGNSPTPATPSTVEVVPKVMTYQELVDYPMDCKFKDQQLVELKNLQTVKNFDPDPDLLTVDDHAFNSRLKATIWWYAYRCDQ